VREHGVRAALYVALPIRNVSQECSLKPHLSCPREDAQELWVPIYILLAAQGISLAEFLRVQRLLGKYLGMLKRRCTRMSSY
jgi:hypothetical protein